MTINELKGKAEAYLQAIENITDLIRQKQDTLESKKDRLKDPDMEGWYKESIEEEIKTLPHTISYLTKIAENISKGL